MVPYSQAFRLLEPAATESITLGNTLLTVVMPNVTEAVTLTLEPGSVVGQEAVFYSGAYAVTVQSNVTSGNPAFNYPDNSNGYSWTIPAGLYSPAIKLIWDGTNWRARTFGQEVVAPATQNNAAVQLGQVLSVAPQQSTLGIGTPAASTTYTVSNTFTAPCAGYVLAMGNMAIAGTLASGADIDYAVYINGVRGSSDNNPWPLNTEAAVASVTAGESVTCEFEATTNSTAPGVSTSLHIANIFIPNP
jgi:hypothetical protein